MIRIGFVSPSVMSEQPRYVLDGDCFSTLEEFAAHFSERVLQDHRWTGNLDAFNDILRGGFGTPESGFTLIWRNSDLSRQRLGYAETVRQLESRLVNCHPLSKQVVASDLQRARAHVGPTVFDWLVAIISDHGPGGSEADDGVHLELQ